MKTESPATTKTPERVEHTPVFHLHNEQGRFIGFLCGHCGAILTPSMNLSEPLRTRGRAKGIVFVANKRHTEREVAAHGLRAGAQKRLQQAAASEE